MIAKPQLRGAEGAKLTLNLGQEVPIVSTSYTPIATGGAGVNPLELVPVRRRRRQHRHDAARHARRRHHARPEHREQRRRADRGRSAGTDYPSFVTRKVGTRLRLRDGESNLLAGLLRETSRTELSGFPGAIHVPVLKQVFSNNTTSRSQTESIMLLTPHIVRTSEITESDLRPIYIGSQQNLGLGGPPPLIAATPEPETPVAPLRRPRRRRRPGCRVPIRPARRPRRRWRRRAPRWWRRPGRRFRVHRRADAATRAARSAAGARSARSADGTTPGQPATVPTPPRRRRHRHPRRRRGTGDASRRRLLRRRPLRPPEPPSTTPGVGAAQVLISPPDMPFRVGEGPYTVPMSIANASRLSTMTLTLIFDPALLRVRTVQEGSFMRSGGVNATFTQQVGPRARRHHDLARRTMRPAASGTGLLAAILFDAVAPGTATLTLERHRHRPGRDGDGPAVQAGHGHHSTVTAGCF